MRSLLVFLALGAVASASAVTGHDGMVNKKTTKTTTTTTKTTTETPPTTLPPSSTTPPPPTTTPPPPPPPGPLPPPSVGKWAYYQADNTSCIIVQIALQLNITYLTKDDKLMNTAFNVPVNTTHVRGGQCGNTTENIMLWWPASNDKNSTNNTFIFSFEKNSTSQLISSNMSFYIVQDPINFPNAKDSSVILSHVNSFTIPVKKSYRCAKQQVVVAQTEHGNNTILMKDLQIQAFHDEKGETFDSAMDCSNADVPDIVPIAVGCALGGLVLIVLVAYLVGRRRSASGYLSM